jgi:hypothetical protein
VSTGKGTFKVPTNGLRILPDGTPVNPVQEYRTLLDKKKAAETRKKLKPFLTWANACKKLGGEFDISPYSRHSLQLVLNGDHEHFEPVAAYYFPWHTHRRHDLFADSYTLHDAFIQVPVPVGEMRRPTQWD